jgi:hydroxymethylpyrimidine pyrophosphatase-like HAD family hydrolase
MGNSTEGLKELAKYVTDTVDNDGAAPAIEKFAL